MFVPNPPPHLRSTLHIPGSALGVAHSLLAACQAVRVAVDTSLWLSKGLSSARGNVFFFPIPEDPGENSHDSSDQKFQSQGCCVWSLGRSLSAGWCAQNVTMVKHLRCFHI